MTHTPVLLKEAMELLSPRPGEFFVDGTVGGGGHARGILERLGEKGTLLALDWDKETAAVFAAESKRYKTKVITEHANYADLPRVLEKHGLGKADGLLLDLGFSSWQVDESGRGFSFRKDEPLYMTYDEEQESVASILSRLTEQELAKIIRELGGERYAGRIAKAIKDRTKKEAITSSLELAEVVKAAVPAGYERGRIDPATRTFQALRIYANEELENLKEILDELPEAAAAGGRVVIISFHSLEDGMVKRHFRKMAAEGRGKILTARPVRPTDEEKENNPRSRSAKLRAFIFNN